MKFLLLAVGLALIGAIQAIENISSKKDLVVEKIVGRWYLRQEVKAMDFPIPLLDMDIKEVNLTPEGNLELDVLEKTDKCVEKKFLAKKTAKSAEFEINIPSVSSLYTFSVMETDYDNYILFCLRNIDSREKMACAHYVRRIEEDNKGMEEFKKILRTLTMPYTVLEVRTKAFYIYEISACGDPYDDVVKTFPYFLGSKGAKFVIQFSMSSLPVWRT
ncbi:beta-lactoglobulin-like [Dromiciops gliroides]|uniref:beta-lactoglobulin-like n=1 Tax=Dromiciops gliroides TaxID=33562 RepID=UPI001CC6C9D5|nr:beta-lactoglobulin-like [Dromiciops gliroides]